MCLPTCRINIQKMPPSHFSQCWSYATLINLFSKRLPISQSALTVKHGKVLFFCHRRLGRSVFSIHLVSILCKIETSISQNSYHIQESAKFTLGVKDLNKVSLSCINIADRQV